jgi:hypothetical protein
MLLQRHEILRTGFVEVAGALRQRVHHIVDPAFETVDLRGAPVPIDEARRLALADARRGFDLASAPLVRMRLLRTGSREYVLQFNMHHIISDGWSMDVLVRGGRCSSTRPRSRADGCAAAAAHPVSRLRRLAGGALASAHAAAARILAKRARRFAAPLDLPTDFPRPAVRSGRGGRLHLRLEPALYARLAELACRRQVSMFMLLTALVKVLLYRYSGESDITVGFPIAGRETPDLDGQIGLYANTLVLRSRLHDAQSFTALLDQIRISAAAAYDIRTTRSTSSCRTSIRHATRAAIHCST